MRIHLITIAAALAVSGCGNGGDHDGGDVVVVGADGGRTLDGARGRTLFVDKGCVICHAVNGVGGKAATPLDAPIGEVDLDPLEFAARMWLGAPAMIELQAVELGYSIFLTAEEIGDLAAFAASRDLQKTLSDANLPDEIREGLLDTQFWEMDGDGDFSIGGEESEQPEREEAGEFDQ